MSRCNTNCGSCNGGLSHYCVTRAQRLEEKRDLDGAERALFNTTRRGTFTGTLLLGIFICWFFARVVVPVLFSPPSAISEAATETCSTELWIFLTLKDIIWFTISVLERLFELIFLAFTIIRPSLASMGIMLLIVLYPWAVFMYAAYRITHPNPQKSMIPVYAFAACVTYMYWASKYTH